MRKRPSKVNDLLVKTIEAVSAGRLLYSNHANERMFERKIVKPEINYVLVNGYHEAKKDQFNVEMNSWDYAIRGKTLDGRRLRIIIALVRPNVLVVTAIDLSE
jgi:hypothetical protein